MGLPQWVWVKKTVDGVKTLSQKEKNCAQSLVKKVMLTVFWDIKGLISIDVLEKGATVNSASHSQQLRKFCQVYWITLI